jgi:hypothetical protein
MRVQVRRCGLLAITLAVCVACRHLDGQCTLKSLGQDKLPPELVGHASEIDAGSFSGNLCARGERIGGAQWTILFERGVLRCTDASHCAVASINGIDMQVVTAEGRIHAANVLLSPDRVEPLLADERVRYIMPACSAFPDSPAASSDLPVLEVATTQSTVAQNDPPSQAQLACRRSDTSQWGLSDACVPVAQPKAAPSEQIAVLDSGLDCLHPAIHRRIDGGNEPTPPRRCTPNSGRNYLYPDLPPDNCDGNMRRCSLHGTAVGGIIASDAQALPGVDPNSQLISMRVLRPGSDLEFVPLLDVATAILDSAERAKIINISANWYTEQPVLAAAIDAATADHKHLIVSAARGDGKVAYPAEFTNCNDAVIGVADVWKNPETLLYEWGLNAARDEAFMVAPGVRIRMLKADSNSQDPYMTGSGSSFAAPYVSGAASLVWSSEEFKGCRAAGIREILECSARVTLIGEDFKARKRLHLGCLFSERDLPICRGARRCIESTKKQFCS